MDIPGEAPLHSQKIVGGMFGLESPLTWQDSSCGRLPGFLSGRHIKLASARSAFRLLESFLAPKSVWLPSYLCGVVLDAFRTARIQFYPVDRHLRVSSDGWLRGVAPNDMVVFIDYFGFCHWSEWGAAARLRGAWVVEDACQAMLNPHWCEHSHYIVFSARKFVGVPDGGVLVASDESRLPQEELPPPPAAWWIEAFAASEQRAEFDKHGGDRCWFQRFQRVDASAPITPARMSELSALLLAHVIDYDAITRRRRENYLRFASVLPEFALYPELPADVVPLGFPIRVPERDKVLQVLYDSLVFPPVHWPLEGFVPKEFTDSHGLSREIMTLPCDQRVSPHDVSRVVTLLHNTTVR